MLELADWSSFTLGDLRGVILDLVGAAVPGPAAAGITRAITPDLDVLIYLVGTRLGATPTAGRSMQHLAHDWSAHPLGAESRMDLWRAYSGVLFPLVVTLKDLPQVQAALAAGTRDVRTVVEDHLVRIVATSAAAGRPGTLTFADIPNITDRDMSRGTKAADDIAMSIEAIGVDRLSGLLQRWNPPHGHVETADAPHVEKILRRMHEIYTEWPGSAWTPVHDAVLRLVDGSPLDATIQTLYAELPRIVRAPSDDPADRNGAIPMSMLAFDSWAGYTLDDLRVVLRELVRLGYDWRGEVSGRRVRDSGISDEQWVDVCDTRIDALMVAFAVEGGLVADAHRPTAENLQQVLGSSLDDISRDRLFYAHTCRWVPLMMRDDVMSELHRSLTTPGVARAEAIERTLTRFLHPRRFVADPELVATYAELDAWDTTGVRVMNDVRDDLLASTADLSDERFGELVHRIAEGDADLNAEDARTMDDVMWRLYIMNFRVEGSIDARIHHAVGTLLGWDAQRADDVVRAVALRALTGEPESD